MDCNGCEIYKTWSGMMAQIEHLNSFEARMVENNGTIDRIWAGIESKISKPVLVTAVVLVIGFISTMFGLVYATNQEILGEVSELKVEVSSIKEKMKSLEGD